MAASGSLSLWYRQPAHSAVAAHQDQFVRHVAGKTRDDFGNIERRLGPRPHVVRPAAKPDDAIAPNRREEAFAHQGDSEIARIRRTPRRTIGRILSLKLEARPVDYAIRAESREFHLVQTSQQPRK